ncbi:folliculin-interacting protein N-terminus-domain-containing protein [Tricladium varicosporioides]|nr:folliculin-interacting protein N-terminus-domain-containing protein [Hymenoscyphus varicosporioides]
MSLLGKLFSGLPSSDSATERPKNSLDSNLEDQFTHNLLFPSIEELCHNDQVFPLTSGTVLTPAAITNFDINGEIDLEMRDVRVIIMQEATPTSGSAYLLYDSHTPPPPSPSLERQTSNNGPTYSPRTEGRRSISSPRKTSVGQISRPVVIQQETPAPRAFGAFDRRQTHQKNHSYTETEGQRSAREYREEVTTFSNCIFGNSEVLAYKGTGTKVHILPSESRSTFFTSASYSGDTHGSFGRSSMRSSKLAQSFTSENLNHGPISAGFMSPSTSTRGSDRKKVLITRMFPVLLPNAETEDASQNRTPTAPSARSNETGGYPFPKVGQNGLVEEKKQDQPKQKRTPMYAVGLIVHLPPTSHAPSIPASRSSFRSPGSYNEQESFPSSFSSTRRSGWTMLGNGFGVDSLDSSFSSDVDDRIEMITQHWDIIMRTLSHLQAVATAALLPMLRQADISSPDPQIKTHMRAPSASISISGKRVVEEIKPFKIPKTNAKFVQVVANCLMSVQRIHKEVDLSRQRIISGIKTCQVITGQGRWGIWRDEARTVGKWAGGKNEGFFFFNLLTGFLGNHTEWLQALGPTWYRRRHYQNHRSNKEDDVALPARTVIVSANKLMARRLVFLLSAFLPASQQLAGPRHRPSTSASFGGYSQSPPNYAVPILREESLRRRINKRGSVVRAHHSRTMSFPVQTIQQPPSNYLDIHHHDRRTSDAASIKTANLPIPGSDLGTRKSSAATTSTATPIATMPHFSTRRTIRGTGPDPRPGSSGSLATDDLLRSLKRGDSSGQYSNGSNESQGQNSRWSMLSGFWSSKRRDSSATTNDVEPLTIPEESHASPKKGSYQRPGKLVEMVEEASCCPLQKPGENTEHRKSDSGSATTVKMENEQVDAIPEQIIQLPQRVPDPMGAYQSPVKTSINEDDGVIDIDVPLPEYLSFETAVSSPSSSGYLSTPGLGNGMEGFEHYSRTGPELDTTMNVGGWLPRYHPDFALQAVPPQDDLLEEVKASMREEPTPNFSSTPLPDNGRPDRWVDVSSAIIADTTNFTIKHIRYRRLVRPRDMDHVQTQATSKIDSRYGNVYTVSQLTPAVEVHDGPVEERFIEEPIISMDETLIQAVEKIIAQSGQASKESSVCSSRSASRKGENRDRSNSGAKTPNIPEHRLEVHRNECKKTVLSALEEIVREVAESRKDGDEGEKERESFLREGVRSWLTNVEANANE